ncbi:MAG: pyridoxamine 5'-phosphate oxidase family protein, partial [Desulfomonilia bacterium]|nr:pyridoxamine 5'-phosphate oxidase family protein [Desulfomonilia bacterium]
DKYVGKRLHLTKITEEKNAKKIEELRRERHYIAHDEYYKENKYLVTFRIDEVLPLIGTKE